MQPKEILKQLLNYLKKQIVPADDLLYIQSFFRRKKFLPWFSSFENKTLQSIGENIERNNLDKYFFDECPVLCHKIHQVASKILFARKQNADNLIIEEIRRSSPRFICFHLAVPKSEIM